MIATNSFAEPKARKQMTHIGERYVGVRHAVEYQTQYNIVLAHVLLG